MAARIDAVGVTARDMGRSVAFYRALGFTFEAADLAAPHVEADTGAGLPRLMIDSEALARDLLGGETPRPANHACFALLCEGAGDVDARAAAVDRAGFEVATPPWDAPWGQRYATVRDPDGYLVDLFAPLDGG